jgi:hypothetical protein
LRSGDDAYRGDAAVHQEVAAGDAPRLRSKQERGEGGDLVDGARPAGRGGVDDRGERRSSFGVQFGLACTTWTTLPSASAASASERTDSREDTSTGWVLTR